MLDAITRIPGWHLALSWIGIFVCVLIHVTRTRERRPAALLEIVLLYTIGIKGFGGITNFVAHAFFGDTIAAYIGWPADNLFQLEVAGANLGIGLLGFLGFWRRDFWLPYLVASLAFGWTAGAAHMIDLAQRGNVAVGNAGPILYLDILVPLTLILLYYWRSRYDLTLLGLTHTQPFGGVDTVATTDRA